MLTERWTVSGPGGSTWVAQQRRPGDVVWDTNAVAHVLGYEATYPRSPHVISIVMAVRESVLRWLEAHTDARAFVVVTDADESIRIAARIKARALQLPNSRPPAPRTRTPRARAR